MFSKAASPVEPVGCPAGYVGIGEHDVKVAEIPGEFREEPFTALRNSSGMPRSELRRDEKGQASVR
jgi:hypothetical protein